MSFFSDLRDSGKLTQILTVVGALIGFALLALLLVSGFLVYRVVSPPTSGGSLNPEILLGRPSVVTFSTAGSSIDGWFFPGRSTAPTIILAHGYLSQREDLLTLVTALQEHQYNVFMFDFSGHGSSTRFSTLGYRETKELLAAVKALAARDDVDRTRFGVWGTSLGAYAAVAAAAEEPRIRALAIDSVYDDPMQMLNLQVERSGLNVFPLTPAFCRLEFRLLNFSDRHTLPLSQRMGKLAGVPKLFIEANDNRALAEITADIFQKAPDPRELKRVSKSIYSTMTNEEKSSYEGNIVQFFLQNLPPVAFVSPPRL